MSLSESGLSVFDLTDSRNGSVTIIADGHSLALTPGRHVHLTRSKKNFGHLNEVPSIAHRNLVRSTTLGGMSIHHSEFSLPTAIMSVEPLKAVFSSTDKQCQTLSNRLLKTSALLYHLSSGKPEYQHYVRPQLTALVK